MPKTRTLSRKLWRLAFRHSTTLIKIGGLGFAVCLGYFLYAIYGGGLQTANPERAYRLIAGFGRGLVISSFLLAVGLIIRTMAEAAYAVVVGICAVGLMFGLPSIVANNLTTVRRGMEQTITELSSSSVEAGVAALLVVGARIIYEIYIQVRQLSKERQKAEADAGPSKQDKESGPVLTPFSPCWQLPYCQPWLRESCPAYKNQQACWKYGSGCICDPSIIDEMIDTDSIGTGELTDVGDSSDDRYMRSDLHPAAASDGETKSCRECPIFQEHQRIKYRYVTPALVITMLLLVVALYGQIVSLWSYIAQQIVIGTAAVALGQFQAESWFRVLNGPIVTLTVVVFVVLMAVSYTLRFVEWAVLERKIL